MTHPQIIAPAGDRNTLAAVVGAGADAVYFGVRGFNMRARAKNFTVDELPEIIAFVHDGGVRAHLTLNTIIYQDELDDMKRLIRKAADAGIDMIVCWDPAVIQTCIDEGAPFCVSTQASVSNAEAFRHYCALGAKRVVLARECTLEQIRAIRRAVPRDQGHIEVFVHGAMCVAVSGRCFLSHHLFDRSANRGECVQPCRREYEIRPADDAAGGLILGEDYILSPKDLCTLEFVDQIIDAGVDAFKIEGRMRSAEYAARAVSLYKEAVERHGEGELTPAWKAWAKKELAKYFNRGFSDGFYFGRPGSETITSQYGSHATARKIQVGRILNYYKKPRIAYARIEAAVFTPGDEYVIIGPTTGAVEGRVESLQDEGVELKQAHPGAMVTFPCEETVRLNDILYKYEPMAPHQPTVRRRKAQY